MSIEAMKTALEAIEDLRGYRPDIDSAINALRTSIQQAEAQQDNTACRPVQKRLATQQPVTGEPVRGGIGMGAQALAGELAQAVAQDDADPEGHDMSAGLFGPNVSAWLRKVAYYAGKQPATGEPAMDVRCEGCGYMTHHRERMGCVRAAKQHTHQAPSVPMTNEQWTDVLGSAGPDLLDLAKQWSDNKVHVYQVVNEAEKIVKAAVLRGITAQAKKETP